MENLGAVLAPGGGLPSAASDRWDGLTAEYESPETGVDFTMSTLTATQYEGQEAEGLVCHCFDHLDKWDWNILTPGNWEKALNRVMTPRRTRKTMMRKIWCIANAAI